MTRTAPVATLSDEPAALSFDQRVAIVERLQQLSKLENADVEQVATLGLTTLAAHQIGLRAAVRDALARLSDGTYGDCETCRRPIPAARLVAVPYARRCVSCQQREEESWDQVRSLIGSVVSTLVGEPQGRPQPTPKLASPVNRLRPEAAGCQHLTGSDARVCTVRPLSAADRRTTLESSTVRGVRAHPPRRGVSPCP